VKNSSILSKLQDSSNIIVHFLCCKSGTCAHSKKRKDAFLSKILIVKGKKTSEKVPFQSTKDRCILISTITKAVTSTKKKSTTKSQLFQPPHIEPQKVVKLETLSG
jgi:hypothetical protein